ncbi:cyclic pyranopterin monophosphate synthase subunit MoaA [Nitrospirillum pindoramense]|uniref:GTP 3',8-cyclase n=2 Tax=Nitrospirillum amazonense TaxID=28077 RepID=A0A560GMG9_9PROT|nr:cyclic pyranopterin monophosphate synthase subunit MoaA [Nitrospirillum amazonense]
MADGALNTPLGQTAPARDRLPLVDPFGRSIRYLRVSVTDRCDFRCVYCMAEEMTFLPKAQVLSLEELERLCAAFIQTGVRKLRLTGGEPLVRRGIMDLVRRLGRHLDTGALDELTLTTNGSQLTKYADELRAAGVRRVNVSLDTLDPDRFQAITRWGKLAPVLEGIRAAKEAGLHVKVNCVALRGVNDGEVHDLVAWCGREGHDLTFIEVMPLGDMDGGDTGGDGGQGGSVRADQYWPLSLLRAELAKRWTLTDLPVSTGGPARYAQVAETGGRIGFITPMTHNFCESCNRVRLTCTGMLYMCLGQEDAADLRAVMRAAPGNDATLLAAIKDAIARKPKGHDFIIDRRQKTPAVARHMSVTGG